MFDVLACATQATTFPSVSSLHLCTCNNCREMSTDLERKCCGQQPERCISRTATFELLCLNPSVLRLVRDTHNDILALEDSAEPGTDNWESRYAAYRQYVVWQYGAIFIPNRLLHFFFFLATFLLNSILIHNVALLKYSNLNLYFKNSMHYLILHSNARCIFDSKFCYCIRVYCFVAISFVISIILCSLII